MFIEAILLGVIIGFILGGNFNYFNKLNIKGITYILLLAILDLILRFLTANVIKSEEFLKIYPYLSLIIYVAFIIFLDYNKNIKYFRIMESGFILNLLPMILNGGKMPVSESAMIKIGDLTGLEYLKAGVALNHTLINNQTRFKILSDIIPIKFLIPKVISAGDIILAIGLVLFIIYYMTYEKKLNRKELNEKNI